MYLYSLSVTIIPAPHLYAYFTQFDWLVKKFYTSINSMSSNFGNIFLPPAPKMNSTIDKNKIFSDEVAIIRNKLLFLRILSMCKLRRITHKLNINPFGSLHMDKIHKNKIQSYNNNCCYL